MHPPRANTWAIVARPIATRITPAAAVTHKDLMREPYRERDATVLITEPR